MASSPQLFALGRFLESTVDPVIAEFKYAEKIPHMPLFAVGNLIETYWWLLLGVELGYFPLDEADCVIRQRHDVFIKMVKSFITEFSKFPLSILVNKWQETPGDEHWFIGDGNFFSSILNRRFHSSQIVCPQYQSAMILSTEFTRKREVASFLAKIAFADDFEWENLLKEEAVPTHVAQLLVHGLPDKVPSDSHTIYAGFFQTLDHMESVRELFSSVSGTNDEETAEYRLLEECIGMIDQWRMNLTVERTMGRFNAMVENASNWMKKSFHADLSLNIYLRDHPGLLDDYFKYGVYELTRYWKGRVSTQDRWGGYPVLPA